MRGKQGKFAFGFGLIFSVAIGLSSQAWAQYNGPSTFGRHPGPYLPDGPYVPTITPTLGNEGAAGLPPDIPPPPKGFDQQSIWNMQVVGFSDNQGRASSDDGWIEDQNGRYIAYIANSPGSAYNPLTGQTESNGTSLIDVTNPANPVYLDHIPSIFPVTNTAGSGATHVAVCGGNTLAGDLYPNHWFMVRHSGSLNQEIWDVTNPRAPFLISILLGGPSMQTTAQGQSVTNVGASLTSNQFLTANHHIWWECDTGIAYMIAQSDSDGFPVWNESGSKQHIYIFDLHDPHNPVFIREWGLVGQQPGAATSAGYVSCYNGPGPNCYEGFTNPPAGVHQAYSAGLYNVNTSVQYPTTGVPVLHEVYFPYGVGQDGVVQITDRDKLLDGCTVSTNSDCANFPTQGDLLYPQISYVTMKPSQGGHTSIPIFGVPIPQTQTNWVASSVAGTPQTWDLLAITSEQTANDCAPQDWKNPTLLDITPTPNANGVLTQAVWPFATLALGQFPGNFCEKGARFGIHELNREIYAPYYGKIIVAAYFNAGIQVWDIRDPTSPRRIAYFIQAPNGNTLPNCASAGGILPTTYCPNATFSDLGEVDDRGYIYNMDRAGSGVTVLQLKGNAAQVITGQGAEGGTND
ncbi:MAG: hypothetical protein WA709_11825 [Stellaceae bacterium]